MSKYQPDDYVKVEFKEDSTGPKHPCAAGRKRKLAHLARDPSIWLRLRLEAWGSRLLLQTCSPDCCYTERHSALSGGGGRRGPPKVLDFLSTSRPWRRHALLPPQPFPRLP
jgi:hypothetical protein